MNTIEKYASLLLAEKITRGETFNEGMEIVLSDKPTRTIKATKEIIESATRTALERNDYGFELSEADRLKAPQPKKQGG
jgi:hypothetical protein